MKATGRTLAAALSLVVAASASQAATCADRTHVVTQLEQRFNETLIANAVSAQNAVLEIYAAPNAATWSILVTLPDRGLACLAATGKGKAQLEAAVDIQPAAYVSRPGS